MPSLAAILLSTATLLGADGAATTDMERESARIVSRHKVVYTKPPIGSSRFSPDAVLLGNGDVAMAITETPLPRDSKVKKQDPGKVRFWFTKNDFWQLGGRTKSRLFAVMDCSFEFDQSKGPSKYQVETDIYTATTYGRIAQGDDQAVTFKAWVSAAENMIFIEFASAGKQPIRWRVDPRVMSEDSDSEVKGSLDGGGLFMRRAFPRGTPPTGMSMCVRKFAQGRAGPGELGPEPQVFAFAVDSLMKNPRYAESVTKKMAGFNAKDMGVKYEAHKKWWAEFWAKSFIEIPDKVIERQYYVANYVLASCCRDKDFPPGILTTWFCTDGPRWSNDYHLNYNYQAAFYSLYGSNHVELGEVQDQPLLDYMQVGRKLAKERLSMPGILYPVGIGPKGTTTCGNNFNQKTDAAYGAVNMIFRWKTTYDLAYARKVYPYFKELTTFWEAYLKYEKGADRYVIENDSIHEQSGDDFNSIVSLALVRAVFATALDMSKALSVDAGKCEKWNHILAHLSAYATMERDGKTIFRYTERGTEYWKGNTLGIQHIYPALGIGLESDPRLIDISRNMIDYMQRWSDNNGDNSFFPAAAQVGYKPDVTYAKLHEYVSEQYRPNGLRNRNVHGAEKLSTIPNTVNMMLCSVDNDVMRLYPAWPRNADARFASLRQFGAFLVGSRIKGSQLQYVTVLSEKGRDLTLVNPWPGQDVQLQRNGKQAENLAGDRFKIKTAAGESLSLAPAVK